MQSAVYIIIATAAVYIVGKLLSFFISRRHKLIKLKSKPVQKGLKLIYSDQKAIVKEEGITYRSVLKSERFDITGKPDYIYEKKDGSLFPVEIKSGEIGNQSEPHQGDLMQLAAYFAIIEDHFENRPKDGLIVYRDFMFQVKNTARLRRELVSVIKDMREMLVHGEGEPAAGFAKCRNCVCRGTVCEYCEDEPADYTGDKYGKA